MKKGLLVFVTVVVLALLAHQVLPWYAILLAGLLGGFLVHPDGPTAWWAGLAAGLLTWGGQAVLVYWLNDGLLAGRIGELFGGLSGLALLGVTAALGGLGAGLGTLTGALVHRLTYPGSVHTS